MPDPKVFRPSPPLLNWCQEKRPVGSGGSLHFGSVKSSVLCVVVLLEGNASECYLRKEDLPPDSDTDDEMRGQRWKIDLPFFASRKSGPAPQQPTSASRYRPVTTSGRRLQIAVRKGLMFLRKREKEILSTSFWGGRPAPKRGKIPGSERKFC